jgi:tripartite-type tricarboxylate transporter receptor subunit TctC
MLSRRQFSAGVAACAPLAATPGAFAQSADHFYKNKTINLIIGYPPGGANDVYARLIAQYMGKYIPGNPSIVPQNMPGAGSFVAANNVYNVVAKDGLTLALGAPTLSLDEKLGTTGVHYKTADFGWIGRLSPLINIVMTWKTCPVKTMAQALTTPVTLSGTGAGSTVSIYPTVLNNALGAKFKLVMGYVGSREAMLAMERGEVEGHSTAWDAVKAAHPDWKPGVDINVLVQFALERDPELADVPTAIEFAKTDEDRRALTAILSASDIGIAFFTTPGVPADRLRVLREAFDRAAKDPGLLADAKKMKVGVAPLNGVGVQKLAADVVSLSPALLKRVKEIYPTTG